VNFAAWRLVALAGAVAGVAVSPFAGGAGPEPPVTLVLGSACCAALAAAAPGSRTARAPGWLALLGASTALLGLGAGALRVAAIDAGALRAPPGTAVTARGFVLGAPHRGSETTTVRLATPSGRLLVESPKMPQDLAPGSELLARGRLRAPRPWEAGNLARAGIAMVLTASQVEPTGAARGGLQGLVDCIRNRASAALGEGTTPAGAALLRGFVLGEDDGIDQPTVDAFRRSGLAHLLAVSGENVALLALLAAPILALFGVPLRARLICLLGLIGLYVLVTGAGPSIQRAGAMGAAAVIATLAGRPRSRWYVIGLAALATLLAEPRATGDPGWQLSFAAAIGIMLLAGRVRDTLLPSGRPVSRLAVALAEGAGVTVAAGLATAPLIALDFGTVSLATLPANLLALPAVAPVMWLGMLVAALGQVPGLPAAVLTAVAGALAGYVAQVAQWLGSPAWAQVTAPPAQAVLAGSAICVIALVALLGTRRRRRGLRPRRASLAFAGLAALIALALGAPSPGSHPRRDAAGLRVVVLDVGQGDAILLDPSPGRAVLIDGGPRADSLAGKLSAFGVSSLAAALVTHDQSDHAGGTEDLLGSFPIDRLVLGVRAARLAREARAAGTEVVQVAEGSEIDSGRLQIELLWPPRELERRRVSRGQDPNTLALVALARWRRFSMLLTADAEAEAVPVDPGPIDVLKVAHHGSADAALPALLAEAAPSLAVISVGAGNPYGHPSRQTLAALAGHDIPVLRTDLEGDIEIDVTGAGWFLP
jgi:competence protein ComEC